MEFPQHHWMSSGLFRGGHGPGLSCRLVRRYLACQSASKKHPDGRGSIFPKYEPVASHGDPIRMFLLLRLLTCVLC